MSESTSIRPVDTESFSSKDFEKFRPRNPESLLNRLERLSHPPVIEEIQNYSSDFLKAANAGEDENKIRKLLSEKEKNLRAAQAEHVSSWLQREKGQLLEDGISAMVACVKENPQYAHPFLKDFNATKQILKTSLRPETLITQDVEGGFPERFLVGAAIPSLAFLGPTAQKVQETLRNEREEKQPVFKAAQFADVSALYDSLLRELSLAAGGQFYGAELEGRTVSEAINRGVDLNGVQFNEEATIIQVVQPAFVPRHTSPEGKPIVEPSLPIKIEVN